MAVNDTIADMLSAIRNGQSARLAYVQIPASRQRKAVLDVLVEEGYLRGYADEKSERGLPQLKVELKYHDGLPVIQKLDKVSTPGRRAYTSIADLKQFFNGLGITILSTSKGVMADYKARQQLVGGEILCRVF
jgi:small subunit ribosomal protein S8